MACVADQTRMQGCSTAGAGVKLRGWLAASQNGRDHRPLGLSPRLTIRGAWRHRLAVLRCADRLRSNPALRPAAGCGKARGWSVLECHHLCCRSAAI
jgi:hypothetical protein